MDRTLFAALIGAVGGLVVWVFNWLWLLYSKHEIKTRVWTMLSIEIEENLAVLQAFSSAAQNHVTLAAPHMGKMQLGDKFATTPLPAPKHATWEGLLASIPLALEERKIREVHQFHFDLDELARLKMSSKGVSSGHEWFEAFEARINALLKRGNPLKK